MQFCIISSNVQNNAEITKKEKTNPKNKTNSNINNNNKVQFLYISLKMDGPAWQLKSMSILNNNI